MIHVSTERASQDVDVRQLDAEIRELQLDGYVRVDADGDLVYVRFDQYTEQSEIDAALDVAQAHVKGSRNIKLYRYMTSAVADKMTPPFTTNYVTGINYRLHPTHSIIVDGEIRRIDYYAQAEMDQATGLVTYDDLVVREDFVYQRDAVGFARGRVQTITWFTEDGSPHPQTKQRMKLYEPDESLREGKRRRGNITDKLAMDLAGWLMATQTQLANPQDRLNLGRDFMRHHKTSFDMFVEAASAQILYDVRDDDVPAHAVWIDDEIASGVTIRATIIDALNIWNLPL